MNKGQLLMIVAIAITVGAALLAAALIWFSASALESLASPQPPEAAVASVVHRVVSLVW